MDDLAPTTRIAFALFLSLAVPAMAQQGTATPAVPEPLPPVAEQGVELTEDAARDAHLDALFDRLAQEDADDWERVQNEINTIWNKSGSDSMDLLARRADKAMATKDYETALLHLDDLTRLAPDFAEGWNKRATVYFLQEEYGPSLDNIARTLRLEPRHFGALSGLGIILDRLGDSEGALAAFRRASRLHPNLDGAQEGIKKLSREVDGERL
ncbi:MAG: hypothetical protein AB8B85_14850 [Paracoccaceae bacterium]